ncbi:hypothetical protein HK099_007638 [Clydaea vesicula]|uniref:Ribosome recycling factor domain-containing protein n=1 Tax=Clydaea vesicula TaxID=447962 RepID=A0AAD5U9C3_9FUNG|nr:hypothetical protein HK099_007638 [Clydaea vesicula]KAJ3394794.1 hypothetical protein HDU92_006583 [Lobulomyces angularis]
MSSTFTRQFKCISPLSTTITRPFISNTCNNRNVFFHLNSYNVESSNTKFIIRTFAKKKEKNDKTKKLDKSNNEARTPFNTEKYSVSMENALAKFKQELSGFILGRASPSLLDNITVLYKDNKVPFNTVAHTSVLDNQTLMVHIYDEEFIPFVEKAIRNSDRGYNPVKGQHGLLVPIPRVSKEGKDSLLKACSLAGEKSKTIVRKIRSDARSDLKKLKMPSDDSKYYEDIIQVSVDEKISEIDKILTSKQNDIKFS